MELAQADGDAPGESVDPVGPDRKTNHESKSEIWRGLAGSNVPEAGTGWPAPSADWRRRFGARAKPNDGRSGAAASVARVTSAHRLRADAGSTCRSFRNCVWRLGLKSTLRRGRLAWREQATARVK